MEHLNHVTRRGAVYVWRRRLPEGCTGKGGQFVQVSLRTKSLSTAKVVAALVNSAFATSILVVKNKRITRAEARSSRASVATERTTARHKDKVQLFLKVGREDEAARAAMALVAGVSR